MFGWWQTVAASRCQWRWKNGSGIGKHRRKFLSPAG